MSKVAVSEWIVIVFVSKKIVMLQLLPVTPLNLRLVNVKRNSAKIWVKGLFAVFSQVPSHLENSKFHHHQSQSQPVKQYLTLGSKLASSPGPGHTVPHPHSAGQLLATVPIMRNGHMPPVSDGSNPNSPVTLLNMANHDSEVSWNRSQELKTADYVEVKLRDRTQNVPGKGEIATKTFSHIVWHGSRTGGVITFEDFAMFLKHFLPMVEIPVKIFSSVVM